MLLAGRPENRTDHPLERVDSVLHYFFGQKKVVEKTTLPAKRWPAFVSALGSKYHFIIFWGFIIITLGSVETLIQGLFPAFAWRLLIGDVLANLLIGAIDLFSALVLALVVFAVFRRVVLQPRLIPMTRDAAAILGAIAGLMVTLLRHALRRGPRWRRPRWWAHVVILLAFLNYLLYSKHSHIIAALPNIYFRKLGQRGVLPKLNMEADDIAATGVVQEGKDFTWKSLLDGFACTECARCTNFCPAYNTGKPLSPMQVVHDLRDDLRLAHARPRAARRDDRDASSTAAARGDRADAAHRRANQRGGALGLHHLRRLPGGLPGLHRPAREDPADAPEPGAGAGEGAARSGPHVHQPGAQRQPLGNRRGQADGLGGGDGRPDPRRQARRRVPALGRLRRRLRRPDQEADARAGRGAARGGRRLRGARPRRGVHGRPGAPVRATRCCTRCRRSRTSRR